MPKPLITGSDNDEVINGLQVSEEIQGLGGNDVINGNAGDDDIYGGGGDDTILGGTGNDVLSGGAGTDLAVLSGNLRDYNFVTTIDGDLGLVHARGTRLDGSDVVRSDVERIQFSDRTVDLRENNAPELQNDGRNITEDTRLVNASSVLSNDFDVEAYLGRQTVSVTAVNGNTQSVGVAVTLTSGAELTMRADGTYDYNPAELNRLSAGESYQDSFTYTVTDSSGASNTAMVTVTVAGRNDAPVATHQTLNIHANDEVVTGTFVADDIDTDDDPTSLTYQLVGTPTEGTITPNGRSFSFSPGTDFQDLGAGETREVTFSFRAVDQHGAASKIETVAIEVVGVNDAPTIVDADTTGQVAEQPDGPGENTIEHSVSGVVAFNDVDTNNSHSITITPAGMGYLGSFNIEDVVPTNGTGAVNWTFNVSDVDLDSLGHGQTLTQIYNVTISDGTASITQQVTVMLNGTDDAPEFVSPDGSFTFAITENRPVGSSVGVALAIDPDDADLSYSIVGGTGQSIFSVDAHGNITSNGPLDHETAPHYTLDIQACDANGAVSSAHIDINILDRPGIVTTLSTDGQTQVIEEFESNDLFQISRLSTDMSLQFAIAAGTYENFNSARAAASAAQIGVVDVGVAYYLDQQGNYNAVVAVDEDSFGTMPDLYLDLQNIHFGEITAQNFEFIA